jgi:hypothetical protein
VALFLLVVISACIGAYSGQVQSIGVKLHWARLLLIIFLAAGYLSSGLVFVSIFLLTFCVLLGCTVLEAGEAEANETKEGAQPASLLEGLEMGVTTFFPLRM